MEGLSTIKLTKYIDPFHLLNKKHIIKIIRNQFTEYKTLLQTFSLEEQIDEINDMIRQRPIQLYY